MTPSLNLILFLVVEGHSLETVSHTVAHIGPELTM